MSELFDAREQSHAIRSQDTYTVYIGDNGASYTAPPPPPGLLSKAGDVALAAGEAVVDAAMDPVGTAKATGRAVAGGLRDTMQGVVDLSAELGGIIETKFGSLGYLTIDENGVNYSKEPPAGAQPGQLGDLPDVAKGDSMAEGLARGLVQFGAGMAVAPIRGAGMGANMLRSGFADALLNPEEGNLSSMLKGMGLDSAVLDFLDSKVDGDAGPEERLQARFLQAVEGTAIGIPIDAIMAGFRLIRSNKEAVETVRETLAQAPPPTDTQVMPDQSFFDKAGEATDKFVTPAATTADEMATDAALATDNTVFPDATDKFITQAATTTDEVAANAALATDKFVSPNAADKFVTQAAATTDEMATNAALATDKFVSPTAQPAAGQVAPGDLSKQIDDARAAYEAAPNDPQLRINYFDLRKQRDADPVAQVQPPTDAEPGIIAFHGSASDFDQFRLEKIGTGEGAQAYGYGLYFADKEDIADFYRGALTDAPFDYKIDGQSVSKMYRDAAYAENYELADVLEQVQLHDTPKTLKAKFTVENGYTQETADFVADLDYTKLTGVDVDGKEIPLGRIYKVGLTPKPDDLLDYDKALSGQSENVQTAFKKVFYDNFIKGDADLEALFASPNALSMQDMGLFSKSTGAQAYRELADRLGKTIRPVPLSADGTMMPTEQIASQALFEAGIPGIKYLDGNSRNSGAGSTNYVIFDDSMIKILEKYGIVGPVAISAAVASKGGQKDDET